MAIAKTERVVLPFDGLERGEEIDALKQAVAALPHHLRQVFTACSMEGKTMPAAAREFGLSEGVVNGRLYRARRILRSALRSRGFEIPEEKLKDRERA